MRAPTAAAPDRAAYLAWGAICIIWGTTYLGIKIALETVPPFLVGGIRYVIAGGTLLAGLLALGQRLPPRSLWPRLVLTGGLLLGLGNGGVVVAEQWVPSGLAAVVIATTPFWMVGVDACFPDGESLTRRHWSGLILGFLGILLLVWPDLMAGGSRGWQFVAGILALQVACGGWAVGSSLSRRMPLKVPPVHTAALQMFFGGLWMLAAATALGEWHTVEFSWRSSAAVVYLTFVGGLAGFGAYIYALSRLPVSFVSLYAYVNPIIAVALGTLLLAEPFSFRMAVAIAVVLAGTVVVSSARRAAKAVDPDGGDPTRTEPEGDHRAAAEAG